MADYQTLIEWIGKYLPNPQAIQLNQWIDQLRKENADLREKIDGLKKKVQELSAQSIQSSINVPDCPNCSTTERKVFMNPIPKDFVEVENATHECPSCGFKMIAK